MTSSAPLTEELRALTDNEIGLVAGGFSPLVNVGPIILDLNITHQLNIGTVAGINIDSLLGQSNGNLTGQSGTGLIL